MEAPEGAAGQLELVQGGETARAGDDWGSWSMPLKLIVVLFRHGQLNVHSKLLGTTVGALLTALIVVGAGDHQPGPHRRTGRR